MIYFPSENATDAEVADKELADLSKTDAVFVKVPFSADREKSPWAEETVVPTSKLLSDNPSRDYGIAVGKMTIIVADSYGNEYYRMTKAPSGDQLKSYLDKVKDQVTKTNEKLQKNLDKANEYLTNNDRKNALKMLLKNFKEGVVGVQAQEDSIRAYHDILDAARSQMAELVEKGDKEGLKALAKDVDKTDMEKEIDEALAELK
ncbi:MAG: hypothetical protein H6841_05335 [Planctomycetes bacterium]|nr:hypothetical protein [Planctomycetota bacterium]MCB9935037.1 hypothetical protein [Planctomycetota bacterium]